MPAISPLRIAAPGCLLLLWLIAATPATGQIVRAEVPYYTYGSGVGISPKDSLFLLNIRFRIQSRFAYRTESTRNLGLDELQSRLQRIRFRLDGFLYRPELIYILELGFSELDMGVTSSSPSPSIVKDAIIIYRVGRHTAFGLGLSSLPRNRQAVVSSGDLELVDRSPLTAAFSVQRDFGLQLYYYNNVGSVYYALRGAVTAGEGENALNSENGLSYMGRAELLPLGVFENNGDYFEGDLEREEQPKVSVGISFGLNHNTTGTGGGSPIPLYEPRTLSSYVADLLFKYRGLSFSLEYLSNKADRNPITRNKDGEESYVYVGAGQNWQLGYILPSDWGVAARYARLNPEESIREKAGRYKEVAIGFSKYIKGHRLKVQSDVSRRAQFPIRTDAPEPDKYLLLRVQVELGI